MPWRTSHEGLRLRACPRHGDRGAGQQAHVDRLPSRRRRPLCRGAVRRWRGSGARFAASRWRRCCNKQGVGTEGLRGGPGHAHELHSESGRTAVCRRRGTGRGSSSCDCRARRKPAGWPEPSASAASGHSVSKNLEETTNLYGKMMRRSIAGDDKEVERLGDEIRNVPKNLIVNAFPVLKAGNAVVNRVKSAKEKISRFVSGARKRKRSTPARPWRSTGTAPRRPGSWRARFPLRPTGDTFVNRSRRPIRSGITPAGRR